MKCEDWRVWGPLDDRLERRSRSETVPRLPRVVSAPFPAIWRPAVNSRVLCRPTDPSSERSAIESIRYRNQISVMNWRSWAVHHAELPCSECHNDGSAVWLHWATVLIQYMVAWLSINNVNILWDIIAQMVNSCCHNSCKSTGTYRTECEWVPVWCHGF